MRALIIVACLSGICQATPILDQESWNVNGSVNGAIDTTQWQQEVVAGMDGQLTGIDLSLGIWGVANNGLFHFGLNLGEPWQRDADNWHVIYQAEFPRDVPVLHIDTTEADMILEEGDRVVFSVRGSSFSNGIMPEMSTGGTGLWFNHTHEPHLPVEKNGYGLAFRTYMDPDLAGVPEPSTLLLAIGSLITLALPQSRR